MRAARVWRRVLWVEHTVVEGAEFCVRWSGWQPCLFVEEVHGLVAELETVNAGLLATLVAS